MRKVCPKCSGIFETHFLCPSCGVQLRDPSAAAVAVSAGDLSLPDEALKTPVWQRFFAGLALGVGMSFALRELGTAYILAHGLGNWWSTETGHVAALICQAVSVLVGGMVAAAGRDRGAAVGAAVGLLCAAALVLAPFAAGVPTPRWALLGAWEPMIVLGVIGGLVGAWMWPPLSRFDQPRAVGLPTPAKPQAAPPIPIHLFRVLAGAALAVGCTVWATDIRNAVLTFGAGLLGINSHLQGRFVCWAIAALAMILGGVFAGATTRGGARHGFLAGLVASTGVFIIHLYVVREPLLAQQFVAELLDLPIEELSAPQTGLFLLTNTLPLSVVGGWVGRHLFPRVTTEPVSRLDRGAI